MTPWRLPQQELANISLGGERALPYNPGFMKPARYPSTVGQPDSLKRMMCNRTLTTLNAAMMINDQAHSVNCNQQQQQEMSRKVCFEAVDYGYGDDATPVHVSPSKKRRFERRNSKTPAMLMATSYLRRHDADSRPVMDSMEEDVVWDGGLEIAEELVRHLQNRRQPNAESG